MTDHDAWLILQNYFDLQACKEKIMEEKVNFSRDWSRHKIIYRGKHSEFAKMLVNKKFLIIENRS